MSIKEYYNSIESQKTYLSKKWLMKVEDDIFNFFSDKNVKILDLWCWWWRTTVSLFEKWFTNIVWVDYAEELIKWAKKNNQNLSHLFHIWDATNLSNFTTKSFDIVFFSFNWIDYIQNKESRMKAYSEISRVLKKWGIFIFSSHNRLCLPINRNLLKTHINNIFNINSEYWNTKQSFWEILTYYSNPYKLKNDLEKFWFNKLATFTNNSFLFPLLDTFPYYVYKKN